MSAVPDYAHCKHCGRVICWDDWSYVHLDGWANCRKVDDERELDDGKHAEVLESHPIDPQPISVDAAWNVARIAFIVAENGTRIPWRKGDPMPVLIITADQGSRG